MKCPRCGAEMGRYDTTYKEGGWSGWQCPTTSEHHIFDEGIDVEEVMAHQEEMRQAIEKMKEGNNGSRN